MTAIARRSLLLGGAACFASLSAAGKPLVSAELELHDLKLGQDRAFGRALVLAPKQLPTKASLLVLLHGLGETHDQEVGARAFAERYGLLSAVARLSRPPLVRTLPNKEYFGPGRLEELNGRLAAAPYVPPVIVCPYTPNPWRTGGDAVVERYAAFVSRTLKVGVEERLKRSFEGRVMLSGVSLGGYLAIQLFQRNPEAFCGVGLAQAAFNQDQATRYASGIAAATEKVGPRRVEILSSSFDPYRRANEQLHRQLERRDLPSRLRVSPGPHDQSWLKESGTIEMLISADDVLGSVA
jgi:pimeloyl-ACP methyl ester carboxylesterase